MRRGLGLLLCPAASPMIGMVGNKKIKNKDETLLSVGLCGMSGPCRHSYEKALHVIRTHQPSLFLGLATLTSQVPSILWQVQLLPCLLFSAQTPCWPIFVRLRANSSIALLSKPRDYHENSWAFCTLCIFVLF